MKQHAGLIALHDFVHPRRIPNVTHQTDKIQCRKRLPQFLFDSVQGEFAQFEQHQRGRCKARDLTAHFGTYGAARAGHHDNFRGQQTV